ncbi:MAG: phosphotransferase [Pseudomonadota bacterium]
MNRDARAAAFLAETEWKGAELVTLAGDASNRRYFRLKSFKGHPAVLMDSPPDKGEDVRPFIKIARHLSSLGLSAPRIFAADETAGFLLLEDLGDALFARVVARDPGKEARVYDAAIEVLASLVAAQVPDGVAPYDAASMAPLAGLAAEWYVNAPTARQELEAACMKALQETESSRTTLVLRDYHAENLLWLPERQGLARVGLLDFQDARAGQPSYDLASLVRDARRDVSEPVAEAAFPRFASLIGVEDEALRSQFAVQSAQRNLRIMGVFARLSLHFGKPHYIDLLPRVWKNLLTDLAHPSLEELRRVALAILPPPSQAHLSDLKARCGTIPELA